MIWHQFINVEVWCNWLAQQTLNLLERDRNLLPHPYALVAKCKATACKVVECRVESVKGSNMASVDLMIERFPVKEVVAGLTPVCRPNDIRVTVAKLSG